MQIASYIDHTILKAVTTVKEVENLCGEAAAYGFAAVCVPPPFVKRASQLLQSTPVKVSTVIGFPFGYSALEAKVAESVLAIVDGADELDVVISLIALKNKDWDYLLKEQALLTEVIHQKNKLIKVIVESGILEPEEIIECCNRLGPLGIDFMKTSTGYAEKGADIQAVQLMRSHLPSHVRIKASGGIRTYDFARQLVEAGADRLGCSASVKIVEEEMARTQQN